ncbi:MAG: O-antigen ligase family protein [Patescibacteria group bacterium]
MEKLESRLLQIVQIALLAALGSPLVWHMSFVFPYITPATFFFQVMVSIATAAFLILVMVQPKHRPPMNPLTIGMTAFFIIQGLLTLTSTDPMRSFEGSVERMAGFWNLLHFYLFFIIVVSLAHNKKWLKHLAIFSIIVSIIASIEYLALLVVPNIAIARYSFGNPGFLANYLVLHLPLTVWFYVKSQNREEKILMLLTALLLSSVILLTGNRAAFLSFALIIFSLCGYIILQKKRRALIAGLVCLLMIAGFGFIMANRQSSFVTQSPFLSKITSWSLTDTNIKSRFILWNISWKGFLEKPLTGWGRESYPKVFEKYYDPQFFDNNPYEAWSDRAHNIIFDELTAGGIINLLSALALFALFAFQLIKAIRQNPTQKLFFVLGGIFLAAFVLQDLFTLDTLASYLPLFLGFAFIATQFSTTDRSLLPRRVTTAAALVILLVFAGATIRFTLIPAATNYTIGKSLFLVPTDLKAYTQKMDFLDALLPEKDPYKLELLIISARNIHDLAEANPSDKNMEKFQDLLIKKLTELRKNTFSNTKLMAHLGIILVDYVRLTHSKERTLESVSLWESLIERFPLRQQFLVEGAEANLQAGNYDKSVELAAKAQSLSPHRPETLWYLGGFLLRADKKELAAKAFAEAVSQGVLMYSRSLVQVGDLLAEFPEYYSSARDIYVYITSMEPKNPRYHMNLAQLYKELGDLDHAMSEAQIASKLSPENRAEIEKFIDSLK